MSKVDITKGMKVYMIDPAANDGAGAVVELKKVTSFNFGGAPATEIDDTTWDNEEVMTRIAGLKDPGQATLNVLHSVGEASHKLLKDMDDANDSMQTTFAVGFNDGAAPPTITTGEFTYPDTRTFMAIKGWVIDWPIDFQLNSSVPVPVSIRRASKLIVSRKVPA
ncbi:hypothetical protein PHACT_12545 [Pseudohongiella acticola]|uniref:Phage tail protein n=1 Tax=Pseudohongiella acticola TaxID=1524254 RepID=A0A1E8CFY5_9GAMM|nr:phage tail tube protein [Pseudohongiella acticola]OFE11380.1 hypothetical protein PHACT_12545 [Pseudohongiella acticola]